MKKTIMLLAAFVPMLLTSCGGGGGDSTKTVINVVNYTGGVGKKWLEEAITGFQALKANTSYENGKTGVEIRYQATKSIDTSSIKTTPKVYFTEDFGFPHDLAGQNALLDITDVVTGKAVDESGEEGNTIESKISNDYRKMLQYNNKYYGLPHYEWYPGLTYNKDLFDGKTPTKKFFYLSKSATNEYVDLGGKRYYFIDTEAHLATEKTCGNDGVYGTDDDGLPTCLPEFVALCQYMANNGVKAMICPGNHTDYTSHLLNGLVASLSTPEALKAYQSFEGNINYVSSIGSDGNYLFSGSGYGTPVVQNIKLNVNQPQDRYDGWKTRSMVERYAASCLLDYLVKNKEQYFFVTSYDNSTDNRVTQGYFINNGFNGGGTGPRAPEIGMMCEGNYWVNEAREDGLFSTFESKNPGVERHLAWMPLPVSIKDPVTEGHGKSCSLLDTGNSYCMVSQSVRTNAGMTAAIKDFLRYIYSDSRLKAFTKVSGICKAAMNYDIASITTDLPFQRDVLNIKIKNGVVNPGHDNDIFYKHRNDFSFSINYSLFKFNDRCFFDCMISGQTARQCFEGSSFTQQQWIDDYLPK